MRTELRVYILIKAIMDTYPNSVQGVSFKFQYSWENVEEFVCKSLFIYSSLRLFPYIIIFLIKKLDENLRKFFYFQNFLILC